MKKIYFYAVIALHCNANGATISNLVHQPTSSGAYELIFKDVDVTPKVFSTNTPNAVILDFPGTHPLMNNREINISSHGIYDVDLIEGNDRTRAVVNLAAPSGYRVEKRGKDLVLVLDAKSVGSQNVNVPAIQNQGLLFNNVSSSAGAPAVVNPRNPVAQIQKNITTPEQNFIPPKTDPVVASFSPSFTARKGHIGLLNFVLPPNVHNVHARQDGNRIVILLDGFYASKADEKRIEVESYKTPVKQVDVFRRARGTEIVLAVKPNQSIEYSSYQNGDVYTVEVRPRLADKSLQKQVDELQGFSPSKRYRGAPLSLNFQDIEVRAVLQIIAEFTNNNIVVSDAVSGNITLRLDSVPWDQALDIILKTKGLGMRENGSVIYIAPATELDQRELDALKVIQERDQLVPARTELIQIKYANAADLAAILERSRATGGSDRDAYSRDAILSSKGTVSVDQRTNTLLVSDIPSKLQAVRDLVARLDEPVRQVLVDARLVLTRDNFTRDLGARFGLTFFNSGSNSLVSGSGSSEGAYGIGESVHNAAVERARGNTNTTIEIPGLANRLGVNMPVAGSSYGLAILGSDFLVDLELSALQTEGKAEIISSPRVVTQDGKKARIASGQQIPYETISEQGSKVEFKNAELSLDVTPRIAPDNRVDLLLDVKNDKPDDSIRSTAGNVGLSTNQIETNVLVDNGETIVLGGVYQQEQSLSTNKVPLLGDLPVVGNAFKKTNKRFNKSELLIFVTPRIIDNRLSDYDKFSNLRN